MYKFFLGGTLFPVTPSKLTIKTKNTNKTVTLINEGDVNILKTPGLKEISFELLLPFQEYDFLATSSFKKPKRYLNKLNFLKINKKPFQFIVKRPGSFKTNLKVTLEDLTITEDAKEGLDVWP